MKKKKTVTTVTITGTDFMTGQTITVGEISRKKRIKDFVIAIIVGALFSATISSFIVLLQIKENAKRTPANNQLAESVEAYIAIAETLNYYRELGFDNGYCKDREHLRRIWNLCRKYEYIVKDTAWLQRTCKLKSEKEYLKQQIEKADFTLFMFMVCMDETNYDPEQTYSNTNGSMDYGITQINNINLEGIQQQMPAYLQLMPWTCAEKNIAGRYVWIRDRIKMGMPWSIMTKERGWKLYDKIRTATISVEKDVK